jgi:AcrR family transcriptional regulator
MASGSDRQSAENDADATSHRSQSSDGDHVREALMDAAIDLLAVHGPDGFSSREVAKAAGVNYGLIHYYFGTRNELLRQAIKHETEQWGATNPNIDDVAWTPLMLGVRPPERTWRSLVHLALNWDTYSEVVEDFPLMRHRMKIHQEHFGDEIDPTQLKAALVASACLQIGWLAVSNWHLESVAATDDERQIIEAFVNDVERSILALAMNNHRTDDQMPRDQRSGVDGSPSSG